MPLRTSTCDMIGAPDAMINHLHSGGRREKAGFAKAERVKQSIHQNGKWKMENGKWKMESGNWKVEIED